MNASRTDERVSERPAPASAMSHLGCCYSVADEPTTALCGYLSGVGTDEVVGVDFDEPDCVVCEDLSWSNECPIYGTCRT